MEKFTKEHQVFWIWFQWKKTKIKDATKTDKDNYLEILNETGALYELDKNGKLKIKAPSSKKI